MKESPRPFLPLVATFIVGLLALTLTAPISHAQVGEDRIAREIRSATSISSSDSELIRRFVDRQFEAINTGDLVAAQRARRALLNIFEEQGAVSIAFRIEFARITQDRIAAMIRGDDVQAAVTALHLAGKCGTQDLINGPLTAGIRDARAAVRSAAASGLREVFLGAGDTAARRAQAQQAIEMLAAALAAEQDAVTAGAIASSLARSVGTPFHGFAAETVAPAQNTLARSLRQKQDSINAWVPALQFATSIQFRRLIDPSAQNSPTFHRSVIEANLSTLALISERALDDDTALDPQSIDRIAELVTASNQTALLATAALTSTSPGRAELADAFRRSATSDNPAPFREAFGRLIDRSATPAGLTPGDFR